MKNFKPEQQVVFTIAPLCKQNRVSVAEIKAYQMENTCNIWPGEMEVVTIAGPSKQKPGFWYLVEYPRMLTGGRQAFSENVLFPLEGIAKEETEKITSELEKVFDPELFPSFV